jgi:uroporphyrinogen decarboxylase
MMRQAGRYLPEFIALRDKYDFFTRCQTPELAAEIPCNIRRIAPDAAILLDILVIPQAMGEVLMKPNFGPLLLILFVRFRMWRVIVPDNTKLGYVFDTIKLTKEMLDDEVPLIGFAGSPWTIMCYAVEGQGSKALTNQRFCFSHQKQHVLLQKSLIRLFYI